MSGFGMVASRLDKASPVAPKGDRIRAVRACCPVHDDTKPSATLSVIDGTPRPFLAAKCFACGAGLREMVDAVGLDLHEVLSAHEREYGNGAVTPPQVAQERPQGLRRPGQGIGGDDATSRLEGLFECLPTKPVRRLGPPKLDLPGIGKVHARYPTPAMDKSVRPAACKYRVVHEDGGKRIGWAHEVTPGSWGHGAGDLDPKACLYGFDTLVALMRRQREGPDGGQPVNVLLVEGENVADRVNHAAAATGAWVVAVSPMAHPATDEAYRLLLGEIDESFGDRLVLAPDLDAAGYTKVATVIDQLDELIDDADPAVEVIDILAAVRGGSVPLGVDPWRSFDLADLPGDDDAVLVAVDRLVAVAEPVEDGKAWLAGVVAAGEPEPGSDADDELDRDGSDVPVEPMPPELARIFAGAGVDPASPDRFLERTEWPGYVLPQVIRSYVANHAEALNRSRPFVGLPVLTVLSAIAGSRVGVHLGNGWTELTNIWAAICAPPGMGKTPALRPAMLLAKVVDDAFEAGNTEAARENAAARARYEHDAKAYKASPDDREHPDEPERIPTRCLVVNDATKPAMVQVMADNPDGVLAFRDELASLVEQVADESGYEASFLAWKQGEEFGEHRKTRKGERASCSVCVLGGVQTGKLSSVLTPSRMGSGWGKRLYLALVAEEPPPREDSTPHDLVTPDLVGAACRYATRLRRLTDRFAEQGEVRVELAQEARELFGQVDRAFAHERRRMLAAGVSAHVRDFFGKAQGNVAGMALLLHLMRCVEEPKGRLDAGTLADAIVLVRYLMAETVHAWRHQGILARKEPSDRPEMADAVLRIVKSRSTRQVEAGGEPWIKTRDVCRGLPSRLSNAERSKDTVEAHLRWLVQSGELDLEHRQTRLGRGKPAPRWAPKGAGR